MSGTRKENLVHYLNINLLMSLGIGAFCYLWFLWLRLPLDLFWREGIKLFFLLAVFLTISTIYLKSYICRYSPDDSQLLTQLVFIIAIQYLAGIAGLFLPRHFIDYSWCVSINEMHTCSS